MYNVIRKIMEIRKKEEMDIILEFSNANLSKNIIESKCSCETKMMQKYQSYIFGR